MAADSATGLREHARPMSLDDAHARVAAGALVDGPVGLVGLELEGLAYGLLRSTDDFAEGVAAFGERRPPEYTGT